MHSFDDIMSAFDRQVRLPWQDDIPPAGRVWIAWFEKSMQRKFTQRLGEFEPLAIAANKGWRRLDLSLVFGSWIARHEFFEVLVHHPKEVRGLLPEFEDHVAGLIRAELAACSSEDVLAVDGAGSLFGLARLSTLISNVVTSIPGRLLVGFPGKHSAGVYRLLDARDGWNYHAVPLPNDGSN